MMDKRRLFNDIARIRKQIFAVTTFVAFVTITLATIIGHWLDFYLVFRNAVLGILIFGALAYLWGYLYARIVERPLVESYREDARKRIEELKNLGTQRLAMAIGVSELSPGMKVVDAVHNKEGALLVRAGAVLTERLIQTLRESNIPSVRVEAQRQIQEESYNEDE